MHCAPRSSAPRQRDDHTRMPPKYRTATVTDRHTAHRSPPRTSTAERTYTHPERVLFVVKYFFEFVVKYFFECRLGCVWGFGGRVGAGCRRVTSGPGVALPKSRCSG